MRPPRRPHDPPAANAFEDEGEETVFRRPNTLMPLADTPGAMVHVLVPQPTGIAPPVRLSPGSLTIGRTEGADLVLPGSDVSRRHCQVDLVGVEVIAGGEVLVTDLGSKNGTYVDGTRVAGTVALSPGARISIGGHQLLYERRSRRELDEAEALEREQHRSNQFVLAILPLPLREGPVRAEWYYEPSIALGGDAFGYRALGDGTHFGFLIDADGEGSEAALHAVTIANLLRQDGLFGVDLRDPAAVLTRLNELFPAEEQNGRTTALFYWAYTPSSRMLSYAAAGIHPAILVDRAAGRTVDLGTDNPALGIGEAEFAAERLYMPAGATLHLVSDGACAVPRRDGGVWTLRDVRAAVLEPAQPGVTEPRRLYGRLRAVAAPGPLPDDICILAVTFP